MAVYAYIATDAAATAAAPIRGLITADSPRQARDQLRARGLSVRDVVENQPAAAATWRDNYLAKRQAPKVTAFLQELSTLLSAAVPLLQALDIIAPQHTGRFQQSILLLRDHVAAGGDLAEAMSLQPALFDDLCQSIVEVGHDAGTLDVSLKRLVDFRARLAKLKNRIAAALTYPLIVLCVGLAVSVFLMTFVVPNLLSVLIETGKPLPTATIIIKTISDTLINAWWLILLAFFAFLSAASALLRSEPGAAAWHRFQLKIPLIGDLIRKQSIARMSMVLATLLKSDVAFVSATRIARKTLRNRVLRDALTSCEQAVAAGRDIAAALEKTSAFPPLVIQIFAVGQASGRLESMLEDLAADYDTQVDVMANRLTSLLEPLMMILLAIVVGFIAFATILPILEAGNVL